MKLLRAFWEKHPDSEEFLRGWYGAAVGADWMNLQDVRRAYPHADGVRVGAGTGTLTVFNVCGNKYRLVVRINYRFQLINIRAVMTHAECDKGKWKE